MIVIQRSGRFLVPALMASSLWAQTATLRGVVTDPSAAVIPKATVTLNGPAGLTQSASAEDDGSYIFSNLPLGNYSVQATAPQLTLPQPQRITLRSGVQTLNLQLRVAVTQEHVTVQETSGPTVSTDAANNASALVLRGTDLDSLSDNPDDLSADLQALAGPAAGPNGGAIFIDGFSGGDLPPKDAIREIRINSNPFSPEYDKLGYGRIEIFTKPGTDKYHGSIGWNFANDFWNSRNAFATEKAPFHLDEFSGTLTGPINKRASFNLSFIREMNDNGNIINGVILDAETLLPEPFTGSVLSTLRRTRATPRIDYQLSPNNTLTVRYAYSRDDVHNAGVGSFNLASEAYRNDVRSQTVQIVETAVLGTSVVNETRFQYYRPETISIANTPGAAVQVLGAFNGGGNPIDHFIDRQNSYELQNYTTLTRRSHTWKFGIRLRGATEVNISPQNYNGVFTFSGGVAPELDAANQPILDPTGQPVLVDITSIESYRRTLLFQQLDLRAMPIRALGGEASQFIINAGNPLVSGSQFDLGAFVGDDWRVRPNLTVNLGLRWETQTNIHDWRDFAPRIGLAWAPGSAGRARPKNVIRAGFGIFYDRFSLANSLLAERYNGVTEQQYVIANPDFFPLVPPASSLPGPIPASTIQEVSSTLRAPYLMQSALAFERELPANTTLAITYANSHGLHQVRSQDINAPLPGTYDPSVPGSEIFPLGRPGPVLLMESAGLYNQNQLIVNVNTRMTRDISLNGSYAYNRAMSNTDGLTTFPGNPYSMQGEYGPAATDIHHRFSLAGTITTKWGIRFNPLLTANTGPPFDITAGRDLYGDTLFNGRPGFATDSKKPGVISTPYGLLDPNPTLGERLVPRNYGRGPGQVMLNMRIGRTFAFGGARERGTAPSGDVGGPGGGGPNRGPTSPFGSGGGSGQSAAPSSGRRYNLTISMQIRNITNHNNPGAIIGNITSPLFGQANQPAGGNSVFSESANNRRLELQTRFTF